MIRSLTVALVLIIFFDHVSTSVEISHASAPASDWPGRSSPARNASVSSQCILPTLPDGIASNAETTVDGQKWLGHILERGLTGRGQHRELKTHVRIESVGGEESPDMECSREAGGGTGVENTCDSGDRTGMCGQCVDGQRLWVAIWQTLPSGVFADPFELKRIHLRGGVEVQVRGPVDLESPAPDSCPTATWTQIQVVIVSQENGQLAAEFEWSLPLHSRYPAVEHPRNSSSWTCEITHAEVTISQPRFFTASTNRLNYTQTRVAKMLVFETVLWLVPAGCAAHKELVKKVTDSLALVGAVILIVLLSWRK